MSSDPMAILLTCVGLTFTALRLHHHAYGHEGSRLRRWLFYSNVVLIVTFGSRLVWVALT